jgi:hypothetical protein
MGRRNVMSRKSLVLSLVMLLGLGLLVSSVSAQGNTTALKAKSIARSKLSPDAKAKPRAKSPAKSGKKGKGGKKQPQTLQQQADELQIKSDALTSLTELLTDRRAKARKRVEMMTNYLKSIDKLDEYENSKTPPPSKKGEMTFLQAVNTAVKHVQKQGTTNFVDKPDEEEVRILKRVCNANRKLAKKTWNEYVALRDQTRAMGAYLDSIDKAGDYKKWAGVEADKQAQAFEQKMKADRAKEVAAYKKEQAKEKQEWKQEAQKILAQQRQDRQAALQRRFQLRQDDIYRNMREHSPAQDNWGGWGDNYGDVYHNRPYYR